MAIDRKNMLWALGGAVVVSLAFLAYSSVFPYVKYLVPGLFHQGQCLNRVNLFRCSNARQTLERDKFYNVKEHASEVDGWKFFTPDDPNDKAYVFVTIKKDRPQAIFYPRVNNDNNFISVHTYKEQPKCRLFLLEAKGDAWTDIGLQYAFDLSCDMTDVMKSDVDMPLVIVLNGPSAQLWFKDDSVLF